MLIRQPQRLARAHAQLRRPVLAVRWGGAVRLGSSAVPSIRQHSVQVERNRLFPLGPELLSQTRSEGLSMPPLGTNPCSTSLNVPRLS